MEPWRSSGLSLASPDHQDRVDLGDDLVRIFTTTVTRLSDEFCETIGQQCEIALAGCDVLLPSAINRKRMAPLVPRHPGKSYVRVGSFADLPPIGADRLKENAIPGWQIPPRAPHDVIRVRSHPFPEYIQAAIGE